jgi:isopentenyl-diphosphate delta-isomerase
MREARISARKNEHLRICLEEDVRPRTFGTGLERYRFVHQALPEIDLAQVNVGATFLGRALRAPLLVSSMTGGTASARAVNRRLAEAAQLLGLGMGVGSQRAALEDPDLADTYRVRDVAPDIFLMANLGAVQLLLNGIECSQQAVEMIEADALILHLNPLQEALQPGGNTGFSGLLSAIERACRAVPVPVIVKEVGHGLSGPVARQLVEAGVSALDVAGAGGTSWSEVERYRVQSRDADRVAAQFVDWGIPTADSIRMVREATPTVPLVASGGIETGIDVAKCIALGADLAALAWPLLRPSLLSTEAVVDALEIVLTTLRVAMFCTSAKSVTALQSEPHLEEVR